MVTDPNLVQAELAKLGPVYVQVVEYKMTHGALHLRLMGQNFHDLKADVYLIDCGFLSGGTLVGPGSITIHLEREDNDSVVVISTEKNEFVAKGLRVSMELPESKANPTQSR